MAHRNQTDTKTVGNPAENSRPSERFRQLGLFAETQGIRFLKELDVPMLRKFRASWEEGSHTALKKLERLRSFFRFAQENGWVENNPARKIGKPIVTSPPTLPFSDAEMLRILSAAARLIETVQPAGKANALRLRALVLLLRYSGLRISDVVACETERLVQGKLLLHTQKTGVLVYCPLPDFVTKELASVPKRSERYWFFSGTAKIETCVTDWQGRLHELFQLANVENGFPHRFRDTFAVSLLLEGVPLERVATLLGHRSVRVTENHYAPWIRERQEQAEADVRRTWAKDPVVLMETKGTPKVHGNQNAVN